MTLFAGKLKSIIRRRNQKRPLINTYDDPVIANYIKRKTQDARMSARNSNLSAGNYRYFIPFAFLSHEETIKVLDFGGGAGDHFYTMSDFILHNIKSWTVVETKSMVDAVKQSELDTRLKFENSLSNLASSEFDLVIASSSIQYSHDPLKTLSELASIKSKYFFVTRMPIWDFPTKTVIQRSPLSSNGPGRQLYDLEEGIVEYELTILNRNTFENQFAGKFEIIFRSLESEGIHKVDRKSVNQYGYLFRKVDAG